MSLALRLAAGVLALAAVFLLPVVLAAKGYFDPPQDQAAYEARLAVAREYVTPARERFFTANPKIRRSMDESIAKLEKQYPEGVSDHRDEIGSIYDSWLGAIAEFSTAAYAHWFAAHFSADDIRAHFERKTSWTPAGMRRFVVFHLHKSELEIIKARTELAMTCHLSGEALPALGRLGAVSFSAGDGLNAPCRDAAAGGWLDPAKPFH